VAALVAQGFGFLQGDGHASGLARLGLAVDPVDGMRIERQLVLPGQAVVEHGHGLVADDDQLLLLEGMEPGDIDMGADAGGEAQMHDGGVGDGGMEMEGALGMDALGGLAGE